MRSTILIVLALNVFTTTLASEGIICPLTLIATPICGFDCEINSHKEFSSNCTLYQYNLENGRNYVPISKEGVGCKDLGEIVRYAYYEAVYDYIPSAEYCGDVCLVIYDPICTYDPKNPYFPYLNMSNECKRNMINCKYSQEYCAISQEGTSCADLADILCAL